MTRAKSLALAASLNSGFNAGLHGELGAGIAPGRAPSSPAQLPEGPAQPLPELAVAGRIVELCGEARSTAAAAILAHAQREGETSAWIQLAHGDLYPPDLAASGIDIAALIVIHVPEGSANTTQNVSGAGPAGQCRAAELLLRSGGFGLVVLDFTRAEPRGSTAWQGRLLGLARQHEARVLILRDAGAEQASLGPLVSLRVASRIEPADGGDDPPGFIARTGRFAVIHEVLKNKSGGPLQPAPTLTRGPWGLAERSRYASPVRTPQQLR